MQHTVFKSEKTHREEKLEQKHLNIFVKHAVATLKVAALSFQIGYCIQDSFVASGKKIRYSYSVKLKMP